MKETDEFRDLYEDGRSYVEKRLELLKLEVVDKSSSGISIFASAVFLLILVFMFLISFTYFLGTLLGSLLNSLVWGFGLVVLFYILFIGISLLFFRKVLKRPIQNFLIKMMLNED
jgi:hypothetical protein